MPIIDYPYINPYISTYILLIDGFIIDMPHYKPLKAVETHDGRAHDKKPNESKTTQKKAKEKAKKI